MACHPGAGRRPRWSALTRLWTTLPRRPEKQGVLCDTLVGSLLRRILMGVHQCASPGPFGSSTWYWHRIAALSPIKSGVYGPSIPAASVPDAISPRWRGLALAVPPFRPASRNDIHTNGDVGCHERVAHLLLNVRSGLLAHKSSEGFIADEGVFWLFQWPCCMPGQPVPSLTLPATGPGQLGQEFWFATHEIASRQPETHNGLD